LEALTGNIDQAGRERLRRAMPGLKTRARTLADLAQGAAFYVRARPIPIDTKALGLLGPVARDRLRRLAVRLAEVRWHGPPPQAQLRKSGEAEHTHLGEIARPLRAP